MDAARWSRKKQCTTSLQVSTTCLLLPQYEALRHAVESTLEQNRSYTGLEFTGLVADPEPTGGSNLFTSLQFRFCYSPALRTLDPIF